MSNPLLAAIPGCDAGYANAVPEHLREGLALYMARGVLPGSFLRAVLANDLCHAAVKADPESLAALPKLARFLMNCAPPASYGTSHAVTTWHLRGGRTGEKIA